MRYNKNEVASGESCEVNGVFTCRITGATKGMSSTGKPMATLQLEVISPEEVTDAAGVEHQVAGRKFRVYQLLDPTVEYGVGRLITALENSGFDFYKFNEEGEFDDDKLKEIVGHLMQMILTSERVIARKQPTDAQRAAKQQGDPYLDGEGKEIFQGWRVVGDLQSVLKTGPIENTTSNKF